MSDIQSRLIRCFAAVFKGLPKGEIPAASIDSVEAWDSTAEVTLLAIVEEEFGVQFDPEEIEYLNSFKSIFESITKPKETA